MDCRLTRWNHHNLPGRRGRPATTQQQAFAWGEFLVMDRRASSALRHGTAAHDAGQNFHVTAGCCATKDVVQAAFTRAAAAGTARGVGAPPPLVPPGRAKTNFLFYTMHLSRCFRRRCNFVILRLM